VTVRENGGGGSVKMDAVVADEKDAGGALQFVVQICDGGAVAG